MKESTEATEKQTADAVETSKTSESTAEGVTESSTPIMSDASEMLPKSTIWDIDPEFKAEVERRVEGRTLIGGIYPLALDATIFHDACCFVGVDHDVQQRLFGHLNAVMAEYNKRLLERNF